jgi:hypothetical protein
MTPTIVSGSEIVVGAISVEKLAPGDIALFALGTTLFAHRFVRRHHDKEGVSVLEFCGDAAAQSDPLVDAGAVMGLVLNIARPGSRSPRPWRAVAGFEAFAGAFARRLLSR